MIFIDGIQIELRK